jgi:hypothetical protein
MVPLQIDQLSDKDRGRWVEYCSTTGQRERGRIKSWDRSFVFVVFRCDGRWDEYKNFTASATLPEEILFVTGPISDAPLKGKKQG